MNVMLRVETPVHISGPEPAVPPGFWTIKKGKIAVLDVDGLAESVGLERIAEVMREVASGSSDVADQYAEYYKLLPYAPDVQGKRPRGNLTFFIRDCNGLPYVPGSSLKGSIRTALIGCAFQRDGAALTRFSDYVFSRNFRDPRNVFSAWWEKTFSDAHKDPFRAISVSDARVINGRFQVLESVRRSLGGRRIPSGYYEYLVSGTVAFDISFDPEIWADLVDGTFLSSVQISSEKDILSCWTNWTRHVLQWVSENFSNVAKIPIPPHPVVLGRNSGWATKTVGYLLRNRQHPPKTGNWIGKRRQGWPLPKTIPTVNGELPGILSL